MADVCWVVKDKDDGAYLCPIGLGFSSNRKEALRFASKAQAFGAMGHLACIGVVDPAVFRLTKKGARR